MLRLLFRASAPAIALSLFACNQVTPTSFSRTGPVFPQRAAGCAFQVLTAPPASPFTELGVVNPREEGIVNAPRYFSWSLDEVKQEIAPFVCHAGGDAAIVFANGHGLYNRATVIKFSGAGAGTAEAASAAPPAAGGCEYDTQCKSQRLCKQGTCVDP